MVTDVGHAFDRTASGKSKGTLLDGQMGLPEGLVSQIYIRWDHGLLPLELVALPWQLRHQL